MSGVLLSKKTISEMKLLMIFIVSHCYDSTCGKKVELMNKKVDMNVQMI